MRCARDPHLIYFFLVRNTIERSFVVLGLLFFSEAFLPLLRNPNPTSSFDDPPDPVRIAVALLLYVVLLVFGLLEWRSIADAARDNKLLCSLIALSLLSASWSPQPAVSLKRAVLLVATTLFGLYFAVRFEPAQQLKLLSLTMAMAIGASIALAIVIPAYGTQYDYAGAWRGIFEHKNAFGRIAVLSVVVFRFMSKQARIHRWVWHIAVVTALASVVLSRSAAAVIVMLAVAVSSYVFRYLLLPRRLLTPAAGLYIPLAIGAAALLTANAQFILGMLGRDSTLTGRTDIWRALEGPIGQRLWFGYGYGGFWLGTGTESESVVESVRWSVQYAHNGVLDLALQLGVVGVAMFALVYIVSCRYGVRWARMQRGALSLWPLCYFAFMLFYNLSDSTIIAHNNIFWILFVGISVSIRRLTTGTRQRLGLTTI